MTEYAGPTPELLETAKRLWNAEGVFALIRGNENWVYSLDGSEFIFRFTANYHRTYQELEAELEWIQYLSKNQCPVVAPVASKTGALVEALNESWCVVVFERAVGTPVKSEDAFTPELFFNWGKTIGQMHKQTKSFKPAKSKRPDWNKDDGYRLAESMIEVLGESHEVVRYFRNVVAEIQALPKTPDTFGLIHADLHQGNFFVQESNKLVVFDFDDSVYGYHAFDLAVPMATMDMHTALKKFTRNPRRHQSHFLNGYATEHPLTSNTETLIDIFITYRMAHLYLWGASRIHHHRTNDPQAIIAMQHACLHHLQKVRRHEW